jgi:anti-anti-sigma regulatory factor
MRSENTHTVCLQGVLGLREAPEVRDQLLAALDEHQVIELDLRAVESLDIGLVQVLLAARRSAEAQGRTILLTERSAEGALGEALARSGLAHDPWASQETLG